MLGLIQYKHQWVAYVHGRSCCGFPDKMTTFPHGLFQRCGLTTLDRKLAMSNFDIAGSERRSHQCNTNDGHLLSTVPPATRKKTPPFLKPSNWRSNSPNCGSFANEFREPRPRAHSGDIRISVWRHAEPRNYRVDVAQNVDQSITWSDGAGGWNMRA
jgi:hypothetical protein